VLLTAAAVCAAAVALALVVWVRGAPSVEAVVAAFGWVAFIAIVELCVAFTKVAGTGEDVRAAAV